MPILANMEIPKPKDWQEFERLVKSYARINWPGCMATPFGRSGQAQNGVDIYIKDKKARYIGIQCKKVTRLAYEQIEKEIEKAKNFKPELTHYIIVTSINRNARLQEKMNILNSQRNEKGLFPVDIIFWEDIIEFIMSDDKAFEQHYPQLSPRSGKGDNLVVHATNNENSIIGNIITIKTDKKLDIKKGPIQDTIGSNTYMKNYVKYLIDRYHVFKKANTEAGKMKYSLIYNAIKREIGFKWDETPCERFEDLCKFIQKRIDDTILGRTQKRRGIKNHSTYKEYLSK